MINRYSRTPNIKEIGMVALLLLMVLMAVLMTYFDSDYFFKTMSVFAVFVFIIYTYKIVKRLFFDVIVIKDGNILIPGRKFERERNLPDNTFTLSPPPQATSSFFSFTPPNSERKKVFGDLHEFRLTVDNIREVRSVTDPEEKVGIMKHAAPDEPKYSMITNPGEIVEISFKKPVPYFNGDDISDRFEPLDSMYISFRNHEGFRKMIENKD